MCGREVRGVSMHAAVSPHFYNNLHGLERFYVFLDEPMKDRD
jgi:hypothetical protein